MVNKELVSRYLVEIDFSNSRRGRLTREQATVYVTGQLVERFSEAFHYSYHKVDIPGVRDDIPDTSCELVLTVPTEDILKNSDIAFGGGFNGWLGGQIRSMTHGDTGTNFDIKHLVYLRTELVDARSG